MARSAQVLRLWALLFPSRGCAKTRFPRWISGRPFVTTFSKMGPKSRRSSRLKASSIWAAVAFRAWLQASSAALRSSWESSVLPERPSRGIKGLEGALPQILRQVVGGVYQVDPPAQKVAEPLQGHGLHFVAGQLLEQGGSRLAVGSAQASTPAPSFSAWAWPSMAFWACWARKGYSAAAFLALRETKGKTAGCPKTLKAVVLQVVPELVAGQQHREGRRL